jgi:hypothetical protein
MKLLWFHLMPYTELPDDFRDKHPSVWVDIHSSLFDPRRAHHMYNDFNTRLFAEKVMPQLGCVFAQWEDRWWPQPMTGAARAPLSRFEPAAIAAE